MNHYQQMIAKHTKENPAHVEAWMRETVGTLDGLSVQAFRSLVRDCADCVVEAGPEMSQRLADSMGIK